MSFTEEKNMGKNILVINPGSPLEEKYFSIALAALVAAGQDGEGNLRVLRSLGA
jgi:hypothetical protein